MGGLLNLQGLTLAALYLLGIVAAVVVATVVQADDPARPDAAVCDGAAQLQVALAADRAVPHGRARLGVPALRRDVDPGRRRSWSGPRSTIPHDPQATHQQQQRESYLGRAGRVIEPAVRPLGWDWRIGCAVMASLPAREIVVATLGVMYHLDDEPTPGRRRRQCQWAAKLRNVTWDGSRPAGVHHSRGPVDHGVLRALRPVCGHAGGDPPRDEQLALAGVHLRLHDDAGVLRSDGNVSVGHLARRLSETMTITWQDIATAGILLVVVGYLVLRGAVHAPERRARLRLLRGVLRRDRGKTAHPPRRATG